MILLPLLDREGKATRILGCALQHRLAMDLDGVKLVRQKVNTVHMLNARAQLSTPVAAAHALKGTAPPYLKLVHSR